VIIDNTTFDLRAERSGRGDGRVYAITYRALDACGNSSEGTVVVYVPHDMGKHLRGLRQRYPQYTPLPVNERYYLYPNITFEGMIFLPMIKR
jgi:hypothetical protein